jgi:phosphate transport system substrate-binding protein
VIRTGQRIAGVIAALAIATAAGCGGSPVGTPPAVGSPQPGAVVIRALGSASAAPLYQEVSDLLGKRDTVLNYQPLGAGGLGPGLPTRSIAFLATESVHPIGNLPEVDGTSGLYVPILFEAAAVIYNLPGLHAPLRLSGSTLADIYLGRVQKWNAREIAASNPGTRLPAMPITVLHRVDPTPLTALVTGYLAAGSRRWRAGPGAGYTISWPGGTGEIDNASMLQAVAQTPGAIGYTDQASALQGALHAARLRDHSRTYVAPTLRAISAVGRQPHPPGQLSLSTINSSARGAYPLVAEGYVLTFRDLCDRGLSRAQSISAHRVLDYLLGEGQQIAAQLSFAPLPASLRDNARAELRSLRCWGDPT